MKEVFVDSSGFYGLIDSADPFHSTALEYFQRSVTHDWRLVTTNYVQIETVTLIQARLGWQALDLWNQQVSPHCQILWIDEVLHQLGEARWAQARERRLSLTDCISFEFMRSRGITEAIAQDEHFTRAGIRLPT